MNHKIISNTLRLHRKQAGLRQIDVAAALGFSSEDRISHWEKGQAFPNIINLFRLARLYKVMPHELYGELYEEVGNQIKELSLME
jgi:transcriptional regulator with XRE-family HTH domain